MRSQQEIISFKLELEHEIERIRNGRKDDDLSPVEWRRVVQLKAVWEALHWCQGHPWTETYDLEYPQQED